MLSSTYFIIVKLSRHSLSRRQYKYFRHVVAVETEDGTNHRVISSLVSKLARNCAFTKQQGA